MSDQGIRFPEYGDGGDEIGSRRVRNAFRFGVAACVLFTWMLWFCEYFLRYEQTERLYLSALTLPFPSARPLLRQAVKLDQAVPEFATPKYLQALAEREEDDLVLPTYEKAYKLDPKNATLAIRYGCSLTKDGQYADARDKFHDASQNGPDNALPMYLEAAVLPWVEEGNQDLRKSLALIARTNSSGKKVIIPRPLWFSNLPQNGYWYAHLRRIIVEDCCGPLRRYADYVVRQAQENVNQGKLQYWDAWLEKLEAMGKEIAEDSVSADAMRGSLPAGAAIQATAGIRIQHQAIHLRQRIREAEGSQRDESLSAQRSKLEKAEETLAAFEEEWEKRTASGQRKYRLPLLLALEGTAVLFAAYVLAYLVARLSGLSRRTRAVPHGQAGIMVLFGGAVCAFVLLASTMAFQRLHLSESIWMPILKTLWRLLLLAWSGFGLLYPGRALPTANVVCSREGREAPSEAVLGVARERRRAACLALLHRYYGIALGLLILGVCGWVISHRVLVSLFPWQINMLSSGLAREEVDMVTNVLQTLR